MEEPTCHSIADAQLLQIQSSDLKDDVGRVQRYSLVSATGSET